MATLLEFLSTNAALLVAIVALLISLRANYTAHQAHQLNLKNKADADRLLTFEKKRELLNEVDKQQAKFATLMMITAQKILLVHESPELCGSMPDEVSRLKSNLAAVQELKSKSDEQRSGIECIDVGIDLAALEDTLANIRRLTIHLEKDIAHEQSHLEELRSGSAR